MVTSASSWEEETRKYISEAKTDLNTIDAQMKELQAKRDILSRELKAFETALQGYLKRTGRNGTITHNLRELLGKQPNHSARLRIIAEQNEGILKIGSTADVLYNFGFIKSRTRQNAYRLVYSLILEMVEKGKFIKMAPSTFKLQG